MRDHLRASIVAIAVMLPLGLGVAAAQEAIELCLRSERSTCVVDGDTLRVNGQRVRILNIDAPEMNGPRCAKEAELGFAAADRLAELLSGGHWELRRDPTEPRDADRYGRPLRLLIVGGDDAGDRLVAEGLARPWGGRRETWCE